MAGEAGFFTFTQCGERPVRYGLIPKAGLFIAPLALGGPATGTPFKARSLSARAVGHWQTGEPYGPGSQQPASLSARRVLVRR
jgi:hypothetical protein